MPKAIKYCMKRILKTATLQAGKKLTIVDAYNKKHYDTARKRDSIMNAQNAAHVNTQWKFVPFDIEIDEKHSHLRYDPDDPRCNFFKEDKFTGNRTHTLKNKSRVEAEEAEKQEKQKKIKAAFDNKLQLLLDKMTPEQRNQYIEFKMKEGD
ncbi:hypothetical protein AB6F95_004639 [Salmonella enterica]